MRPECKASRERNFTPGVTAIPGGVHICTSVPAADLCLLVYRKGRAKPDRYPFPEASRAGVVRTMDLFSEDLGECTYTLLADGREITDPCGRDFIGHEKWGSEKMPGRAMRCRFPGKTYDWEGDRTPGHLLRDTVIYRLNVRSFTISATAKAGNFSGSFRGVEEKIPYIKDLGATAVELMPVYEHEEVVTRKATGRELAEGKPARIPTGQINLWGYTDENFYFAPKASYSSGREKDPCREFRDLVKACHRADLEIYVELYFPAGTPQALVAEAARFWVWEYHVDGIRLNGGVSPAILLDDPVLRDTKIFAASWFGLLPPEKPFAPRKSSAPRIADYNDGFLEDMRCVLRGDEGRLGSLVYRMKHNPACCAQINYIANTNGFTLMDMVSYESRHNMENGENGKDGIEDNRTWNCGVEGPTKSRRIREMRRRQIRNALMLVMLSQGTPLLQAGDEFGNSQHGNNNAWQDKPNAWLDWRDLEKNGDIHAFVRQLIAFRKAHPVFHMPEEPKNLDYRALGHPDVSYHGMSAWSPDFGSARRELGTFYFGAYGRKADGTADDSFYVACNFHWNPHTLGLPHLPDGCVWGIAASTGDREMPAGFAEAGKERIPEDQQSVAVPGRTILILRSMKKPPEGKIPEAENQKKVFHSDQRPLAPQGSTSPLRETGSPSSSDVTEPPKDGMTAEPIM